MFVLTNDGIVGWVSGLRESDLMAVICYEDGSRNVFHPDDAQLARERRNFERFTFQIYLYTRWLGSYLLSEKGESRWNDPPVVEFGLFVSEQTEELIHDLADRFKPTSSSGNSRRLQ